MSSAKVFIKEKDLTAGVKAFGGVYNAILINAKKGDVGVPRLVSDEKQLLKYFTPNETIEVGYSMSYYSALAVLSQTQRLWVVRVANGAKYGGVNVYDPSNKVKFSQLKEVTPYKPYITLQITKIETHQDKITVTSISDGVNQLKAGEILGRVLKIDGANGVYNVVNVESPDEYTSVVTLDKKIESGKAYLTGSGVGKVEAVDGITFDVTNVDTSDIANTVLTLTNFVGGGIDNLAVGTNVYLTDGKSWKEYTIKSIDTSNSTITVDATGTSSFISAVTSGRNSYPAETFNVTVSEGSNEVFVSSGLKGDINWLKNRNVTFDLDVSDGSKYTQSSTINDVDDTAQKLILADEINYPANDFEVPAKATSEKVLPTAKGFEDPTAFDRDMNALFWLYQKDPGDWGRDLLIEIITDPDVVKEPNAFKLNVYKKSNPYVPVESFVLSRIPGTKDGYGRNIYIDDALEASNYVRGVNNVSIDGNILPAEIKSPEFIFMVAGDDGNPVTESDYIKFADVFENKNNYPVTLLLDGGIALPSYQKKLIEIAEERKDCFALLSVPLGSEMNNDYLNEIVRYRKITLNANTSYAAIFTSHLIITDKYNDRDIIVSPDGYAAGAINYSAENYEIWYPPAGDKRGKLLVKDVLIKFKDGEMDYLYDNGINPIRFFPGKGISIWGQKTLSSRPSALDRINIRMLLIVTENAIAEFLNDFLFELNDDMVGKLIEIRISDYLDNIRARKGIQDYLVVSDETNNTPYDYDNHIRNVDVYIKPTQSIEWIYFTTILTPNGLSFKDAQLINR